MREQNWPRHLAVRPAALGLRGLLAAGVGVLLVAGALALWLKELPKAEAESPATQATTSPAAPPALVDIPSVEPPPPVTSAEIARPEPSQSVSPRPGASAVDWAKLGIDDLRARGESGEIPAMEEMARRLVQGIGVPKDQQAGAGWLLRAANTGSPQSAFNVGVMYERGFVVERDSTKAIEWYRKAVDANVPMAKHNLALLLRDGKGAARNVPEAVALLRSAAKQGMAASMFTLGDIHERGDGGTKDPAVALAWFAIAAEFDRQTAQGQDTPLMKSAMQRAQALQRSMTPEEIGRAQRLGQAEFKVIVDALSIGKTPQLGPPGDQAAAPPTAPVTPADPPGWPSDTKEQVRAVQQALFDLKLLKDKPDGVIGPMSRKAIRDFQRGARLPETGEPTKDVYAALIALGRRDTVANSPLPPPPPEAATPVVAKPANTEAGKVEPAKPADDAKAQPAKPDEKPVNVGKPPDPPPPPTSADLAKQAELERIKSIQALLRAMNFYKDPSDGKAGPATRAAIREYERASGQKETGEPTQALLESLREMSGLLKR
jgi:peptidoglycan hydrolase-like protein with peptidoglycan-binding domain